MNKETFYSYLGRFLAFPMVADAVIRLAKRRVYSHIHNGAYMERYWLLREGSWLSRKLGIAIRLHVINSNDGDRAMHTHPFKFRTFILKGGYTERRSLDYHYPYVSKGLITYVERVPGDTYEMDIKDTHQIVSLPDGPATTLFIYGARKDDWYFETEHGMIPHEQYLKTNGGY